VPVLATPRGVALAERATVAAVAGALQAGETTVGGPVELNHLAPSLVGAELEVRTVLEQVTGRQLQFAVRLATPAGWWPGGMITRLVADTAAFRRRRGGGPVTELRVMAERALDAPADLVYRLIADFERHHPRFLPPTFWQFSVEQGGGVGAGTVHSFRLTIGGRARPFRMRLGEPEPGRVLTELDERSSTVTTWVVTPRPTRIAGCGWRYDGRAPVRSSDCSSGCWGLGCCGGCTPTSWSGRTATLARRRPTESQPESADTTRRRPGRRWPLDRYRDLGPLPRVVRWVGADLTMICGSQPWTDRRPY
jgi:predicted thioesterase